MRVLLRHASVVAFWRIFSMFSVPRKPASITSLSGGRSRLEQSQTFEVVEQMVWGWVSRSAGSTVVAFLAHSQDHDTHSESHNTFTYTILVVPHIVTLE